MAGADESVRDQRRTLGIDEMAFGEMRNPAKPVCCGERSSMGE
jgi:hypothetical protein